MSADARLHPRFPIPATADVIGHEVALCVPMADLSMGGCRFAGRGWEAPGTEVALVLSFPRKAANLPLSGIVVRASNRDMGIQFQNLSDEQKWALRKHIRDAQRQLAASTATG
ncbi:MAG: PilZ domain-containing protein [Nannocystales bacterium]